MSDISVTQILKRLRDGASDEDRQAAAEQLYQRYRHRVEQIARGRLSPSGGLSDEEDVAQSAFRSFFGRIETGKLDALVSGGQAWAILARLTRNKAIDSVRYNNAICRGGDGIQASSIQNDTPEWAWRQARPSAKQHHGKNPRSILVPTRATGDDNNAVARWKSILLIWFTTTVNAPRTKKPFPTN